jgi:hypothetical protein
MPSKKRNAKIAGATSERPRGKKVKREDAVETQPLQGPPGLTTAPAPPGATCARPITDPPPSSTAAVDAAQTTAEALPTTMSVGIYSTPLPFECHCCVGFSSADQGEVLHHLAERAHHDLHIEFLAENGDLAQHEVDALNAFDLYKPKQPSRAVQFLAKIRKAAEATTKEPRGSSCRATDRAYRISQPTRDASSADPHRVGHLAQSPPRNRESWRRRDGPANA